MKYFISFIVVGWMLFSVGCANLKINANVPEGYIPRSPKVDSSRVPKTSTHAECREELERAYEYIRYLEHKVEKRENKIDKLERDKKELKRKISRLEDKLEKYED